MNVSESISTCFAKFFEFKGRASRSEYWWFILAMTVLSYLLQIVVGITAIKNAEEGYFASIGMNILFIVIAIPEISAGARRLHDTGKSGWRQLWALTLIGIIPLIIWLSQTGSVDDNEYGKVN